MVVALPNVIVVLRPASVPFGARARLSGTRSHADSAHAVKLTSPLIAACSEEFGATGVAEPMHHCA